MVARRKTGPAARRIALVATAAMALGLFGCSGPAERQDKGTEPVQTAPGEPRQPARSPFTGLTGPSGPVLAVKIDNVRAARPHTGVHAADLVYVEQVEGGQTRLLAVFSSRLPPVLGPVRSARESDLELLRQFGRPALAYSGAQSALTPLLKAAPVHLMPPERVPPGAYFRGGDRPAPHNLYLRPRHLLVDASDTSRPADIGFRFGAAPPGGQAVGDYTVRYPAARYAFTWSRDRGRWLVSMDGSAAGTTDGGRLTAATVIVQHVVIRGSRFHDRLGAVSPYSQTVGSGSAVVLRDGRAYPARWERDAAREGTTFTTPSGDRLNFAPGPVWVLLARA